MKDTARAIAKMYLVAVLWCLVLIATSFAVIALIDGSGLLVDASGTLRAGLALGTAALMASLAAAVVWSKLRAAPASATEQQPLDDGLRSLRV